MIDIIKIVNCCNDNVNSDNNENKYNDNKEEIVEDYMNEINIYENKNNDLDNLDKFIKD